MDAQDFSLTFTHDKKKIAANCRRIAAYKTPMLRVAVGDGKKPEIFIFWEMPDKTVFWHGLGKKKQETATSISYALQAFINPAFKKPRKRKTVK